MSPIPTQNEKDTAKTHVEDCEANSTRDMKSESFSPAVGDYSGAVAKNDPVEIALVKKLDFRIMPTLWSMYFLNYLDRNAIANARLDGLEDDLGLVGTQYNTCISILFVGYLLLQIPSNLILSSGKVRPSIYMGACMAAWAVVSSCTALAKDYKGLVTVRFLLGVTEAPFYPGALYLLSIFYTRKEIATRIAILYSGNILATSVAGLIAAAIFGTIDGNHGLKGWQWLFIIEGVVTFGVAIIAAFLLPDSPLTTRWLTEEERILADARIKKDTVGLAQSQGTMSGVKQAFSDPLLYLYTFMQNMHLSACSFNNFFPTVVGSLGFSRTITLVLTCPPCLFSGMVMYAVGLSSGRFNERTWHITISMAVAMVGYIISCVTMNVAARYSATFLFAAGAYAVNSVILGWITASLGQTQQKKAVSLGFVNTCSMASFIYTPYLYPKSDGPKYLTGMAANTAFAFMTISAAWALRVWLQQKNKKIKMSNDEVRVLYAY